MPFLHLAPDVWDRTDLVSTQEGYDLLSRLSDEREEGVGSLLMLTMAMWIEACTTAGPDRDAMIADFGPTIHATITHLTDEHLHQAGTAGSLMCEPFPSTTFQPNGDDPDTTVPGEESLPEASALLVSLSETRDSDAVCALLTMSLALHTGAKGLAFGRTLAQSLAEIDEHAALMKEFIVHGRPSDFATLPTTATA